MHVCKKLIFTLVWILLTANAHASHFENPHTHTNSIAPTRLKVYGERCSGTNFVMYLLHHNFPALKQTDLLEYGHKHYPWWCGKAISKKKLKLLKYSQEDISFKHAQDCLFVVVVRESYDWLRSFYLKPWDVKGSLCESTFFHFLSSRWKVKTHYPKESSRHDLIDNLNPDTGKPFRNVLELRRYKIQNYLSLGTLVGNFLFVRYEDVRDDTRGFIDFVAHTFGLSKADPFVPMNIVLDTSIAPTEAQPSYARPFEKNPYFPITERERAFINRELDWEVEKLAGYSMKNE